MKYLIIGLGNPGAEYEDTRHNIGFRVVDTIADAHGGLFSSERHGAVSTVHFKGRTLILLKPSTFMNLSGKAVRYWMDSEKIPVERLLIIADDLNLPLGSTVYPRLRVGIGDKFSVGHQINHVLGEWTKEEGLILQEISVRSQKAVESFCAIGLERSMNAFNTDK
jgi:PTH1 family peptidyl-tRNA hydrolase